MANSTARTKSTVRAKQPSDRKGKRKAEKAVDPHYERSAASERMLQHLADTRVAIEGITPSIELGRFPVKTSVGETFTVEADIFCDGHDVIDAALANRRRGAREWLETPMVFVENDRWRASTRFDENALHEYTVLAWRDLFASWRSEVGKKFAADLDITLELTEGRSLVERAASESKRAARTDRTALKKLLARFDELSENTARFAALANDDVSALMRRSAERTNLTQFEPALDVFVDRRAAAFSAWYEMMPRSQAGDVDRHGTFDDVIARLPYVRDLGFDVLYFPPIHPIGKTNRKGRNNSLTPEAGDPGSPYAIGSEDGGHAAIHPELGTFDDFKRLITAAKEHGLEIALDFAIQCSPDHPWIKAHPEWFDWRPNGTIKFAENPPKKYEDIVNVHFYRDAIPDLWFTLRDIVLFWVEQGVTIFRVDNPHTKPFPFWEWMIGEVHEKHPEAIFLAEAFTRPKVMRRLAKVGFSQSYSYFTWRDEKWELQEYLTELTQESAHVMRPNFFVNTPDINPIYLQTSGRPGFQTRLVLAATLAGNYGVYNGFEICEAAPVPGKEEYLNSEKYEIRAWDFEVEGNITRDIWLMNALRRDHRALQAFDNLTFYNAWNDNVLYYGKRTPDLSSFLLFHVNLDPHHAQEAYFEVPLWEFGLPDDAPIEVEDLVTGHRFTWQGKIQHIWIDPQQRPYFIWRLIRPGDAQ
ncbi:alpha-1,4-glucan--maltose-1-phosphate maltosyltransferase [Pararhizobium mangrovi]|uniref:Alpha-1,4-glucan:maltose-1-phosphate maltosyltransferase n=1 Tax=Pararhizobium mangrovi TaxID=2590452 RepID=A0A506U8F7_9HYPH|nr:alpha-1,4-glucan--maltose-1-phosphate maltosyltransferase [Pararhizobium mangrovi]TPW29626.1 alpha-1,4-glucan--maltose-1-phosphate maltosyltransferase [Pararhizobium mangrovi]